MTYSQCMIKVRGNYVCSIINALWDYTAYINKLTYNNFPCYANLYLNMMIVKFLLVWEIFTIIGLLIYANYFAQAHSCQVVKGRIHIMQAVKPVKMIQWNATGNGNVCEKMDHMYCTLLLLRESQRIFDEPTVANHEAMHYMHLRGSVSSVLISCVGNTIILSESHVVGML